MKCSPEETLEMSIIEHFCLLRPQRLIKESCFQGRVVLKENEIENSLDLVVRMKPKRFTEILSNFVGMECAWGEGSRGF